MLVITTIYVICFSVIAGVFAYTRINNCLLYTSGGYVQAKPMFSYYLYIIACVIGAVVGIMIIKEYQKKITANAGTVRCV